MTASTNEPTPQASPYERLGGEAGTRRLIDRFYDIMDTDPAVASLRALHAPELGPMRQKLFEFMSGWLGGPRLYAGCVMSAHHAFAIGAQERDQWLTCMRRALADVDADPTVRALLERPLAAMADAMRNR